MAAKSKRRLSKIENKLLNLDKLELKDVICSICQSILIEPVTLPCYHDFCQSCFNGSIENNALCCPLCRLRIGSWVRTATKQKNIVNIKLWNFIKDKFATEVDKKVKGEDVGLSPETTVTRLSEPGEIRSEYEAELKRLRLERLRLEQKHFQETEILIEKLHKEEEEAHRRYLENLKQDELLAIKLQQESKINITTSNMMKKKKTLPTKPRLKPTTIDCYLTKPVEATFSKGSPILTDDNTSTNDSIPILPSHKTNSRLSPEMLPSYGKLLKNFLDKEIKTGTVLWNKENGKRKVKDKEEQPSGEKELEKNNEKCLVKTRNGMQSLVVSLPLPPTGLLHQKSSIPENRNIETGSVDSMRQELCYFKPIEGNTPTSFTPIKDPLRIPSIKPDNNQALPPNNPSPSRAQFLEGLCTLRNLSLAHRLPSAFVIALGILQTNKEISKNYGATTRSKTKKNSTSNPWATPAVNSRRTTYNRNKQVDTIEGITKLNPEVSLRRTRSMGSITKDDNEMTPKKKVKVKKFNSERKPYLRSDSKRIQNNDSCSPPTGATINNNVKLALKNLSSPLENCDVKSILCEQLRIEKIIEQEKSDLELALKMDAELNGRRTLRRTATKRQVTLNYALRPAKKLKV
ncbi:unnamed protein product [Danaus chrysippus]|uniref:RING-type E3 ubiquitin transferase n=1 Tax=Danaus chrysippus TaxID=151541 RepID=A0A8J2R016_9NEOP|nr:unnamed protein product [Danaus chrysippus]